MSHVNDLDKSYNVNVSRKKKGVYIVIHREKDFIFIDEGAIF